MKREEYDPRSVSQSRSRDGRSSEDLSLMSRNVSFLNMQYRRNEESNSSRVNL